MREVDQRAAGTMTMCRFDDLRYCDLAKQPRSDILVTLLEEGAQLALLKPGKDCVGFSLRIRGGNSDKEGNTMAVKLLSDLNWDGKALSALALVDGHQVALRISRDVVHGLPTFGDVVAWEIERFKDEILNCAARCGAFALPGVVTPSALARAA